MFTKNYKYQEICTYLWKYRYTNSTAARVRTVVPTSMLSMLIFVKVYFHSLRASDRTSVTSLSMFRVETFCVWMGRLNDQRDVWMKRWNETVSNTCTIRFYRNQEKGQSNLFEIFPMLCWIRLIRRIWLEAFKYD